MARTKKQAAPNQTTGNDDQDLAIPDRERQDESMKSAKKMLADRGLMPTVQMLAVKDLIPTEDNARTIFEHSAAFAELADSVKAIGVKMPVIVRPHPTQTGKWDLRAGARRHRAAQLANLKLIPAMVYETLSDEDAFDVTFFENYGREDLTPNEEAKAAAILLEHHHGDLQAVADKFDKSPAWVKRRCYVSENLIEEWSLAIEHEESKFHLWTISHLELIARFDAETQQRFLLELSGWNCPESVKELSEWVEKSVRVLKKAKWDLDEVLVDQNKDSIPACRECPKRSSCQPMLWEDGSDAETNSGDRCLDEQCWEIKQRVFITNEIACQQKKHPGLKPATLAADYSLKRQLAEQFSGLVDLDSKTLKSKKTDPDAVPYFIVGGKSEGSVVWRKPIPGIAAGKATDKSGGKTPQDRRRALDSKRYNHVLKQMIGEVRESNVKDIVYEDKTKAILAVVSSFGTSSRHLCRDFGAAFSAIGEYTQETLLDEVWERVTPQLIESIAYSGPITQVPQCKIDAARSLAHLLQIDFEDLLMKAEAAIPTPKSLEKVQGQRPEDPDGDAEDAE